MRCIGLATFLCVGAVISTSCGAPPIRQPVIDQQQQLIEAQQNDDEQRALVEQLIKTYGHSRYGESSEMRIASDRLVQLQRARETRAAAFWDLLGITLPLQEPLADSQRAELESLIGTFKDSVKGRFADEVLKSHQALVLADEAKAILEKLQLKSTDEELSEAQLDGLIELEKEDKDSKKDYSKTESAAVARRYLRAHFDRRFREDAGKIGLLDPEIQEQLAGQRLTDAQERYGQPRDTFYLRRALAKIIEEYPGTEACQQASAQLVEVQKALNAQTEHSRFIREYWDAVYPDRVRKQVATQR